MKKVNLYLEQCPKNILCQNQDCTKTHFRCYSGICLNGIFNNGMCNTAECKLLHFTKNDLKTEFNISPINGIYRFNICKHQPCIEQSQNNCPFLHPKWAKFYCYNYFMNDCEDNAHQNHKEWNEIRKEVYAEYQKKLQMKCSPEFNLEDEVNYFKQKNICLKNLQGLCEKKNGLCIAQHIFWEDLIKIAFKEQKTLKSCIELNNEENYQSLKNISSQSMLTEKKQLMRLKENIKVQDLVDVIFIMDFSISMQKWMDSCKSSIKSIIESFQKKIQGETLRVGMIGFRGDNDPQKLTYHDLTSDIDQLIAFIAKQISYGGSNDVSDVCSGIEKAMQLRISKHPNSILITILFAIVPYQGIENQNKDIDVEFYQIQPNKLENLMRRYFKIKNNNFFTCVHISDETEKMYKLMKENFEGLFISTPSQYQNFEDLVKFTLQESLNATKFDKIQYQVKYQKLNKQGESIIEMYDQGFQNNLNDQGDIFQVFQCFDVQNNQIMAVKISKQIIEMMNKKEEPSDDLITQLEEEAEKKYKSQVEAIQLSKLFRQRTKNINGVHPVFFSTPILYTLKNGKFQSLSKIYGETFFDIPESNWEEYLNNKFDNETSEYNHCLQAFSHFVFEETKRKFTFICFKGKGNLLSQPTVLNVQINGITDFLNYHQECNQLCQELKLPVLNPDCKIRFQQWISQNQGDYINIFCQNCGVQTIIPKVDYLNSDIELCKECQEEIDCLEDVFCKCCKSVFQISMRQMIATEKQINSCNDCLKCNIQENYQCCYCSMKCPQNLKPIQIEDKNIIICKKGLEYIKQLECQNCHLVFNFTKYIDKIFYQEGKYWCDKCK